MSSGRVAVKQNRVDDERELLLRLLEKEGLGPMKAQATGGTAHPQLSSFQETSSIRASLFPLSYPQEHLWFLQRFEPESNFYNVLVVWRIQGDLDVPRLEASLEEVVWRHEILRTSFVLAENEQPRQKVVRERIQIRLPLVDLNDADINQKEERAKLIVVEEGGKPFDLEQLPLLRGVLVRLGEKDHILGLSMHHRWCKDYRMPHELMEYRVPYQLYQTGEH